MSLRFFVGNFNIDAESPPEPRVLAENWLQGYVNPTQSQISIPSSSPHHVDIYVLGFQEVKHFVEGEDPLVFPLVNYEAWSEATVQAMNVNLSNDIASSDEFVLVQMVYYSSVMLIVAARKSLLVAQNAVHLKNMRTVTHKLHDGVITGKKGICGLELEVISGQDKPAKTIALMTTHFQAYSERLDERIWDAQQVVDELRWPSGLSTTSHDVVILVGDLNYRIVLPIEQVKQLIAEIDLEPLLKADELICNTRDLTIGSSSASEQSVENPYLWDGKSPRLNSSQHISLSMEQINGMIQESKELQLGATGS